MTFNPAPWLDGLHVVFGELIEGDEVLEMLNLGGSSSGKTTSELAISECGIVPPDSKS